MVTRSAMLALICLAGNVGPLRGQSIDSLAQLKPATAVRVFAGPRRIEAQWLAVEDSFVVVRDAGIRRHFGFASIDSIKRYESEAPRIAVQAAIVGGLAGATLFGLYGIALTEGSTQRSMLFAAVGGLLGAVPGLVLGATVGGINARWRLVYRK